MSDMLATTVDKFTFRVPTDRLFSPEGLWVLWLGDEQAVGRVRLGLGDYLQQHSGDVAFAEGMPVGTMVQVGDEVGMIETVKASLGLLSPVEGMVVQVNPLLESTPEVINQDPYGDGWLVVIEVADWDLQKSRLLAADAYFVQMKQQAEDEAKAT